MSAVRGVTGAIRTASSGTSVFAWWLLPPTLVSERSGTLGTLESLFSVGESRGGDAPSCAYKKFFENALYTRRKLLYDGS